MPRTNPGLCDQTASCNDVVEGGVLSLGCLLFREEEEEAEHIREGVRVSLRRGAASWIRM